MMSLVKTGEYRVGQLVKVVNEESYLMGTIMRIIHIDPDRVVVTRVGYNIPRTFDAHEVSPVVMPLAVAFSTGTGAQYAWMCSECKEPVVKRPPRSWTPAWGARPKWSHHPDGEPLCAVMGPGGYVPGRRE